MKTCRTPRFAVYAAAAAISVFSLQLIAASFQAISRHAAAADKQPIRHFRHYISWLPSFLRAFAFAMILRFRDDTPRFASRFHFATILPPPLFSPARLSFQSERQPMPAIFTLIDTMMTLFFRRFHAMFSSLSIVRRYFLRRI